jgi:hypothetical protein
MPSNLRAPIIDFQGTRARLRYGAGHVQRESSR